MDDLELVLKLREAADKAIADFIRLRRDCPYLDDFAEVQLKIEGDKYAVEVRKVYG